jgi:hypothetical protein
MNESIAQALSRRRMIVSAVAVPPSNISENMRSPSKGTRTE